MVPFITGGILDSMKYSNSMSPSRIQGLFKSRLTLVLDLIHLSVAFLKMCRNCTLGTHPWRWAGLERSSSSCSSERSQGLLSLGSVSKFSQPLWYTEINEAFVNRVLSRSGFPYHEAFFLGPIWRWIEMPRKWSPERLCNLPQRPRKEAIKPAMQLGSSHCSTSASWTHYFMHYFSMTLGRHHGIAVSFLTHFSKNLKTKKLMELKDKFTQEINNHLSYGIFSACDIWAMCHPIDFQDPRAAFAAATLFGVGGG